MIGGERAASRRVQPVRPHPNHEDAQQGAGGNAEPAGRLARQDQAGDEKDQDGNDEIAATVSQHAQQGPLVANRRAGRADQGAGQQDKPGEAEFPKARRPLHQRERDDGQARQGDAPCHRRLLP
ncbi:hypothetical protein AZA_08293 [Nitrospirillum viridazoti Y2]|nr:hypothetical protein AZA_08293 [Nitrospirillum amazonense Y2]